MSKRLGEAYWQATLRKSAMNERASDVGLCLFVVLLILGPYVAYRSAKCQRVKRWFRRGGCAVLAAGFALTCLFECGWGARGGYEFGSLLVAVLFLAAVVLVGAPLGALLGAMAAYLIEMAPPDGSTRCVYCGFDLFGCVDRRCPECGRAF